VKPTAASRLTFWALFLSAVGGADWWGKNLRKPVDDPSLGKRYMLVDRLSGQPPRVGLCISGKLLGAPESRIGFMAFGDGIFIWSADADGIGPPMLRAQSTPESVTALCKGLSEDFAGFDRSVTGFGIVCGPSASLTFDGEAVQADEEVTTRMAVRTGDLGLVSANERLERIRDLEDPRRRPYLEAWGVARSRIERSLPSRGEPFDPLSLESKWMTPSNAR
jgi:hypothetical protein